MKLAEKFTFRCTGSGDNGILFTATRSGDEYNITHKWSYDGSEANPFDMTEQELREGIVNASYTVKEILIGSTQAPTQAPEAAVGTYRSGGRYLLQKFTFRVAGGATTYTADLNDGTYEVTYPRMRTGTPPSVFHVDTVKENIDSGNWVDVQKVEAEAPQPEPIPEFKPYVLGDEIRVRHVESDTEYTLKRDREDGNYSIYYADGVEKIINIPYYVDEMNEWFKIGSWKLLENTENAIDGNLLESGTIAEDTININDYFYHLPVEAEDLDLLPDYGVTLDDLRRFAAETGFAVEVDADFCAVYRPAQVPTKFLAADDAELAAVMLAVRTLDKAVDKG